MEDSVDTATLVGDKTILVIVFLKANKDDVNNIKFPSYKLMVAGSW